MSASSHWTGTARSLEHLAEVLVELSLSLELGHDLELLDLGGDAGLVLIELVKLLGQREHWQNRKHICDLVGQLGQFWTILFWTSILLSWFGF